MRIKDLVPKNKYDFSSIERIKELSDVDFDTIGVEVLEWFQDINWPIAKEIKAIILLKQDLMIKYVIPVLQGDDEWWKYWIITNLIPDFSDKNFVQLLPSLERIKNDPSPSEIQVEVYMEVVSLLKDRKIT